MYKFCLVAMRAGENFPGKRKNVGAGREKGNFPDRVREKLHFAATRSSPLGSV